MNLTLGERLSRAGSLFRARFVVLIKALDLLCLDVIRIYVFFGHGLLISTSVLRFFEAAINRRVVFPLFALDPVHHHVSI